MHSTPSNTVHYERYVHTGDLSKIESLEYATCNKSIRLYTLVYTVSIALVLLITEFTVKCSTVNAFME